MKMTGIHTQTGIKTTLTTETITQKCDSEKKSKALIKKICSFSSYTNNYTETNN